MPKRMAVVFDDEALYRAVKVEAARRSCHAHAKDIVAQARFSRRKSRRGPKKAILIHS